MFTFSIQLISDKLIFPFNAFLNLIKHVTFPNIKTLFPFLSITEDEEASSTDLFKIPSSYNGFASTSKNLRSCAVTDFDYDFTSPNPFNWEIPNLVLPNQPNEGVENNHLITFNNHTDGTAHEHVHSNHHNDKLVSSHQLNDSIQAFDPNQNLIQSSNEIFNNFTKNFQNQLKNNELLHIYNNQNHNEILDFSDDEFDNYDNEQYNNSNYTNCTSPYIENDDILPLDDELMFAMVKNRKQDDHLVISQHPMNSDDDSAFPISSDETTLNHLNLSSEKTKSESNIDLKNSETNCQGLPAKISENIDALTQSKKHPLKDSNANSSTTISGKPKKKYKKLSFYSELPKDYSLKKSSTSSSTSSSSPTASSSSFSSSISPAKSDKTYPCPECNAVFKVKGYLTRHKKKHSVSKPFQCPYFGLLLDQHEQGFHESNNFSPGLLNDKIIRCHPTGGFSRRDTFKTHLKALHFVYPTGTRSGDRSNKKGRCAACFKEFSTNKEWLETHVMTNKCDGMLTEYR